MVSRSRRARFASRAARRAASNRTGALTTGASRSGGPGWGPRCRTCRTSAGRYAPRAACGAKPLSCKETTMIHPLEVIGEIRDPARELREQIPDVFAGYAAMQRAAIADGALPGRIKELIALAIAVTRE